MCRRVHCCTTAGTIDTTNGFPTKEPVPCLSAASVAAILVPNLGLTGSVASGTWSLFSDTLLVLDMGGAWLLPACQGTGLLPHPTH